MQRLDHGMIYLLIAGTYTPICLVALPLRWGIPLLGWAAVAATPALRDSLSGLQLALVFSGGVAYTVGFPILLLRRPDPWPRVFGYHEVWHSLTVLAAVLHFGAVALLVA